jgi:hypothetical protein
MSDDDLILFNAACLYVATAAVILAAFVLLLS